MDGYFYTVVFKKGGEKLKGLLTWLALFRAAFVSAAIWFVVEMLLDFGRNGRALWALAVFVALSFAALWIEIRLDVLIKSSTDFSEIRRSLLLRRFTGIWAKRLRARESSKIPLRHTFRHARRNNDSSRAFAFGSFPRLCCILYKNSDLRVQRALRFFAVGIYNARKESGKRFLKAQRGQGGQTFLLKGLHEGQRRFQGKKNRVGF